MKTRIRIVLCTSLAAIAMTLAVFTLAGFSPSRKSVPAETDACYVLGERDGNVAVFLSSDMDSPVTVTDISLANLRQADRAMISAGLLVGSENELMQLLEDLGS